MRIVSMVPSWTETLIAAGAHVVGRTRFCIHPKDQIKSIPAVGGTKDINWEKVHELAPDVIILDREENPKAMADESNYPFHATHVQAIGDVPRELSTLAERFSKGGERQVAAQLKKIAEDWGSVKENPSADSRRLIDLPGVIEWIHPPNVDSLVLDQSHFIYCIWRNPWMAASPGTFIASMLEQVGIPQTKIWPGLGSGSFKENKKYPEFELGELPENTVFLFSSEPFPFSKFVSQLRELPAPSALVDGESFSWFGVRALQFLKRNSSLLHT